MVNSSSKSFLFYTSLTKKAKESFELTFFKFVVIIDFNNKLLKLLRSNVPNTMHLKCVITS